MRLGLGGGLSDACARARVCVCVGVGVRAGVCVWACVWRGRVDMRGRPGVRPCVCSFLRAGMPLGAGGGLGKFPWKFPRR